MNKILYHIKPGTTNFFLGEFPQEPVKSFEASHYVSAEQWCLGTMEEYKEELQSAKEEAIKNGEITNPVLLPITFYHNTQLNLGALMLNDPYKELKDGDIFDLPEGMSVEKNIANGCGLHSFCETCYAACKEGSKTFIRLVPNKEEDHCPFSDMIKNSKPESQEELWNDLIAQWESASNDLSHPRVLEHLQSKFTITRKEK